MYCCLCRLCTVHAVGMPCGRRGRPLMAAGDFGEKSISHVCAAPPFAGSVDLRVREQPVRNQPSNRAGGGGLHYRPGGRFRVFRAAEIPEWILWCSRATRDAVARARGDGGPAFLEFTTYRFDVHHTFEFRADLRYRDTEKVARWRARDPTAIRDVMKSERWPPGWQASGTPAPRRPLSAPGTSEATAAPGRPGLRCSARRSSPRPQGRDSRAGGESG